MRLAAHPVGLSTELNRALCQVISDDAGVTIRLETATVVGGGSISQAMILACGDRRWFLKLNDGRLAEMFLAEEDGLRALAACPAVRVPRIVGRGVVGEQAYLVLEYVSLQSLHHSKCGAAAGCALAELHRRVGPDYGWHRDNFIGSTPQHNAALANWPLFFAHRRLLPQLDLAKRGDHPSRLIRDGERLSAALPALFAGYQPLPSLLHGDLWSGNAAADETGTLTLVDPAVYFGDREVDLAMSELFGGFPESFSAAYREAWPLDDGFVQRKALYNLYHVLNHLNLFGGSYLYQAERMISALLSELRG